MVTQLKAWFCKVTLVSIDWAWVYGLHEGCIHLCCFCSILFHPIQMGMIPFAENAKLGGVVDSSERQETFQRDLGALKSWTIIISKKVQQM